MVSIQDFFALAQLAEASYAKFDEGSPREVLINEKPDGKRDFSPTQADLFLADWQVAETTAGQAHQPNTASGFSSTLFQDRDGPTKYVLAIRGTEPELFPNSEDLLAADVGDIMADGIALDQIVDLYNEWQRISTESYHAAYLETLTAQGTQRG